MRITNTDTLYLLGGCDECREDIDCIYSRQIWKAGMEGRLDEHRKFDCRELQSRWEQLKSADILS